MITEKIIRKLYRTYIYIFARSSFEKEKLNKLLFSLSLNGLGILNYKNSYLSGEEGWVKMYLSDLEKPIIFDVGANEGDYSNTILNLYPESTIYAFEPHPNNIQQLKNNLKSGKEQGKVSIIENAVGDQKEQIYLYDYEKNDGSAHASLYQEVIEDIHKARSVAHQVDVITIDHFCDANNIETIDLLKIDTEGNELKCLLGAKRLLDEGRIKAIQFEFNEMNIISRSTFKDFWDLLTNFDLYRLLPGGELLSIKKYRAVECEIYAFQNIVALKRK